SRAATSPVCLAQPDTERTPCRSCRGDAPSGSRHLAYRQVRTCLRTVRVQGGLDRMDSGDTAWMLASTALVMIMLPGLALFYGGLVRSKNVLSTVMHSFFGLALVSIVWVIVGFSLAFGPD